LQSFVEPFQTWQQQTTILYICISQEGDDHHDYFAHAWFTYAYTAHCG